MSKYVIAEPGGGLVQGECLGLLFAYSGPDSDLPLSEILFFDSAQEAQEVIDEYLAIARSSNSRSLPHLERMRVECVDGVDLENLAQQVCREAY